jgi:hypothetical protein
VSGKIREHLSYVRWRRLLIEAAVVGAIWAVAYSPLGKWRL